jgi:hypothetical protein
MLTVQLLFIPLIRFRQSVKYKVQGTRMSLFATAIASIHFLIAVETQIKIEEVAILLNMKLT